MFTNELDDFISLILEMINFSHLFPILIFLAKPSNWNKINPKFCSVHLELLIYSFMHKFSVQKIRDKRSASCFDTETRFMNEWCDCVLYL